MLHALLAAVSIFVHARDHSTSPPPVGAPIEVFIGGQGGYPVYRIPAATRLEHGAHAGRLLVFAEGRPQLADVTDNDLVLRSSDDGGVTWSPVRVLADIAGRSLNNPCVVELHEGARAGRVLLMFQSYPENMGEHHVVEGYGSPDGPDRVCRTMVMHSDDGGATWSAPREVTRGVKRATGATSTATGPGVGIQLSRGPHKGRVIMPFNEGPFDRWRVYAAYSDDAGESWRAGEVAPDDAKGVANEVQMFERADGAVVLNARQHLGAKRRKAATSIDGGATWSVLADVPELPDPTCMGGVLALGDGVVVFTGCDSETRRAKGAVWFSRDDGRSWSEKTEIEPGGFAYSVPVRLSPAEIGVVYEGAGYTRIVMRRVSVPQAPAAASPAAR
ncbi:MAG: glycoside hydrolase [Planctomycetaceae bacterium]|nr:glycoside hydrolase [Planctomycetaceae bacterium]